MGELTDIVLTASAIVAGSHTAATLGKAYARYRITQEYYPTKSFLERLPRCVYKRAAKPETLTYTATISILAMLAYYTLRNI
ncbi:hypothetical protein GF343_03390 [Candidatus Woesearchaeota archaeon]|nr:hypothetical protein [Candidatus Woesearchaeota archaeon]